MGRSKDLMRFVVSAVLELVMLLLPNPTLSCRDESLSGGPRLERGHVLMLSRMPRVAGMRPRELPIRSRQRGPTSSAAS